MIKDRIGILIGNSDGDKKEQSGFIFIWIVILTHGLDLGSGVPQISQKCLRYSQRASIKDGIGILIKNSYGSPKEKQSPGFIFILTI